jgi:hypothetical protein
LTGAEVGAKRDAEDTDLLVDVRDAHAVACARPSSHTPPLRIRPNRKQALLTGIKATGVRNI